MTKKNSGHEDTLVAVLRRQYFETMQRWCHDDPDFDLAYEQDQRERVDLPDKME